MIHLLIIVPVILVFRLKLIDHLRIHSHDGVYGTGMSASIAQQVISSMNIITGRNGTDDGQSS